MLPLRRLPGLAGALALLAASTASAQTPAPAPTDSTATAPATPGPAPTSAPTPATTPVSAPPGPLRLAGANGREVDFVGIWEARPEGLVVLTSADSVPALVSWDKFDLERMKTEQPALDAARQRAIFLRSPQSVNLGLFAGLLTPGQAAAELRRLLDTSLTVKVPVRFRTTTTSTNSTALIPPRPVIYNGLVIPQPTDLPAVVSQTQKTVTETRFSPDELTTSPRRVLEVLSRTDNIAMQDRRDLFDLVKTNPVVLEETATGLDRIAASLPPKHLLPNDPTVLTFALRLREFSNGLRAVTTAAGINYSDQVLMRDLLYLAESPYLR